MPLVSTFVSFYYTYTIRFSYEKMYFSYLKEISDRSTRRVKIHTKWKTIVRYAVVPIVR